MAEESVDRPDDAIDSFGKVALKWIEVTSQSPLELLAFVGKLEARWRGGGRDAGLDGLAKFLLFLGNGIPHIALFFG